MKVVYTLQILLVFKTSVFVTVLETGLPMLVRENMKTNIPLLATELLALWISLS